MFFGNWFSKELVTSNRRVKVGLDDAMGAHLDGTARAMLGETGFPWVIILRGPKRYFTWGCFLKNWVPPSPAGTEVVDEARSYRIPRIREAAESRARFASSRAPRGQGPRRRP